MADLVLDAMMSITPYKVNFLEHKKFLFHFFKSLKREESSYEITIINEEKSEGKKTKNTSFLDSPYFLS